MAQETDLAVFVYGSLQPGGRNWARYCEGNVVSQQRARVKGRLFRLRDSFPAVVLDNRFWTHGWRLVLRDVDALHGFDELENFDPARQPEQNEYQRVMAECFDETKNSPVEIPLGKIWVYVMAPERIATEGGEEIPTGHWTEP